MMRVLRHWSFAAVALGACAGTCWSADWLQFGYDPAHSGFNPNETVISPTATGEFAISTLFPVWNVPLPARADGTPVLLSGVATPSGTRDLLFLTVNDTNFTASNTSNQLIAIDASSGAPVWATTTATGPNWTTSSPAIDPDRQYVYAYLVDGMVHKYAVGTGAEVLTGGWPETATLKPAVEKGSAALAIATANGGTTYLYVADGGYPGDAGDYQGHVTAINLATGAQQVFNAACSDQAVHFVEMPGTPDCASVQSAIWARPGVIYDAATDRIYIATGNGDFDPTNNYWGDSLFALNPDGTGSGGKPLDSYTPADFQQLQNNDTDLGSTAPAVLPSTIAGYPHLAVQGGKDGELRLLNLDNLSGSTPAAPGHTGGELQLVAVPQGGEVLPQPAVWVDSSGTTWVFVAGLYSGLSGLTLGANGMGTPTLTPQWQNSSGGTSPIIANGVLYYYTGALKALDPKTGNPLWSSNTLGGRHWESPIVVNGRVYVTDESATLWCFALDGIFRDGFQ